MNKPNTEAQNAIPEGCQQIDYSDPSQRQWNALTGNTLIPKREAAPTAAGSEEPKRPDIFLPWKISEGDEQVWYIADAQHMYVVEGEPAAIAYIMQLVKAANHE